MAYTTVVVINNTYFGDIEKNPRGFVQMIRERMNEGPEKYRGDNNEVKVFQSEYNGGEANSTVYLFDGYTVTLMDENSEELKRIMEENPKYSKKLIELMKEKIGKLEKMSEEFEQKQIPL